MKTTSFLVSIALSLLFVQSVQSQPTDRHIDKYQTGFYLVAAEADSLTALPTANANQRVVCYDYRFLQTSERGKPLFLLLSKTVDVPLILAKEPELQKKGGHGFPELHLELNPESADKLETLTRDHLGGKVVFAIDGEPVTIHKIRSVITGGQFQISRCTDTACQYIYGRLVESQ